MSEHFYFTWNTNGCRDSKCIVSNMRSACVSWVGSTHCTVSKVINEPLIQSCLDCDELARSMHWKHVTNSWWHRTSGDGAATFIILHDLWTQIQAVDTFGRCTVDSWWTVTRKLFYNCHEQFQSPLGRWNYSDSAFIGIMMEISQNTLTSMSSISRVLITRVNLT